MAGADAKVIALLGVPGSGKSIVSRRLAAHGFQRIRFSDPQRAMLATGFGLSDADIDGPNGRRPRQTLANHSPQQLLASLSGWGRERIHRDLFARAWEERAAQAGGLVYADDLQDMAEVDAVRRIGGCIVRIHRPDFQPARGERQRIIGFVHDVELVNTGADAFHGVADAFAVAIANAALLKVAA